MIDFKALEPEIRCVALVGEFMRRWSAMESALQEVLAVVLKIDDIRHTIVCSHIGLGEKLGIVRAVVHTVPMLVEEEKKRLFGVLQTIMDNPYRNRIAHTHFQADPAGDGVLFSVVRARGKFPAIDQRWSIQEFQAQYAVIDGYVAELATLRVKLAGATFDQYGYDRWRPTDPYQFSHNMSPALIESLSKPSTDGGG